tara:strand:- start:1105 stop:2661 length:1557 start_codon:yes stop_codon:yes gene_type:complete
MYEKTASPVLHTFAIVIIAFCSIPLIYLFYQLSLSPKGFIDYVTADTTTPVVLRTFVLVIGVAVMSLLIAVPIAWLLERSDLPFRNLFGLLATLPLAIPSYIGSFVLLSFFGQKGLLQRLLEPIGVENIFTVSGCSGAIVVLSLLTYPYLLILLRPAIGSLDPRLSEVSATFGYGPVRTFFKITLPLLRPALAAGGLLVSLYALSDFGAVSLLNCRSLTVSLFTHYESAFDRSGAASVAILLSILALLLVMSDLKTRRNREYSSLRPMASPREIELGWWRWPIVVALSGFLCVVLVVPIGILLYWFSREVNYSEAITEITVPAVNSLLVSTVAGLVTCLVAVPIAILSVRYSRFWFSRLSEMISYTGYALPGLVIALSLVFVAKNVSFIYQSFFVLVIAYVLLFLPQAITSIRIPVGQMQKNVESAARGLGASNFRVASTISFPLVRRGLIAGFVLVFITTIKELPATLILSPMNYDSLSVSVWSASSEAFFARAALPGILLVFFSLIPLTLLHRWDQ